MGVSGASEVSCIHTHLHSALAYHSSSRKRHWDL